MVEAWKSPVARTRGLSCLIGNIILPPTQHLAGAWSQPRVCWPGAVDSSEKQPIYQTTITLHLGVAPCRSHNGSDGGDARTPTPLEDQGPFRAKEMNFSFWVMQRTATPILARLVGEIAGACQLA
ncbi:hypothetical protein MN608_06997 [Microdochium nivale]|nr:hypothetical protein MN608_06997 [Microdochium nivale]